MSPLKKYSKTIAIVLLLDMFLTILAPSYNTIYALTSGPNSPEFSSFEPVATTNLVDPFTGNFTYNLPVLQIPGSDGGGYALSLSYHSGTSSEEESSWVGHGWTLNPGAINRNVRGLPDEFKGNSIDYYNKTRPNWSMSGTKKLNLEIFSKSKLTDKQKKASKGKTDTTSVLRLGLGYSKYVRFNNQQGLAKTESFGLSNGFGRLSMNRSATGITFSANINPFAIGRKKYRVVRKQKDKEESFIRFKKKSKDANVRAKNRKAYLKGELKGAMETAGQTVKESLFSAIVSTDVGRPTNLSKIQGYNFNFSMGAELNPSQVPVGIEKGYLGKFSLSFSKYKESIMSYGYLNTPKGIGKHRSDYFTEKAQPFDRRDYFIGMPFSSPDNYILTGEGLSGSFRAYRSEIGHYFPEGIGSSDNKIKTFGIGVEFMAGLNVGVGVNLAFGSSKSSLIDWRQLGNTSKDDFLFGDKQKYFYRFNGDLGGCVDYGNSKLVTAKLTANPNFPGIKGVSPTLSNNGELTDLKEEKFKPSSYISKKNEGFEIFNQSGLRYLYGKDVNIKNTSNLSINVSNNDTIEKNYLAYKKFFINDKFDVDYSKHKVVVGEVNKNSYSNASLLQAITTSDYVKVGDNELPDDDDFGGWTKFEYHKRYGQNNDEGNSNWYRWRVPYNGLFYDKNSISDTKDDTGSFSSGEKEVFYLKKIETKTHIAYFVTNLSEPSRFGIKDGSSSIGSFLKGTEAIRKDGLGASKLTTEDASSYKKGKKGTEFQLEYLEKIVLFSKSRLETPLQTTYFKYDYTLVPNLPNNINGKFPKSTNLPDSGKLTLRKVWSEFEGVVNSRISSYKFDYKYKDKKEFPKYLVDENPNLTNFFNLSERYSVNSQNPEYSPYMLDAWGNNQYDGENRHLKIIKWPYQGNIPENSFDPAAWQLKQVTLPSGGQILVDYESKDYSYVQDRDVMALVKLKDFTNDSESPTFTIDLSDIGYDINTDLDKVTDLYEKLKSYFLSPNKGNKGDLEIGNRIYFKFLYALVGDYPDINDCRSEYIKGYAKVKDVFLDNGEIKIQLDGSSDGDNMVGVGLFEEPVKDSGYKLTPKQACYDYYVTQRWGKYKSGCEGDLERKFESDIQGKADKYSPVNSISDVLDLANYIFNGIKLTSSLAVDTTYPNKGEVCKTLKPELSYLKIPMNKSKRGGGVRVKRLLMYDKGIEEGDAAIYGQHFRYELEDGRSSGVATNEPRTMREENPLVGFLPKKDQTWLNRLIVGKDREQSEGPIGETLLPNPAVNYSRVVVENIHTGRTGSGYTVNEYYTCKDYPYDKTYDYSLYGNNKDRKFDIAGSKAEKGVKHSDLQENSYDDKLKIPSPIFSYSLDKAWASQGFRFIINNMHGKPKSTRTYGGSYSSGNKSYISSGQDYYYYEPGEKVRLLKPDGTFYWGTPGKEMDVTMERYSIRNQSLDFNFEIDVSVGLILFPPIFASGNLQFDYSDQLLDKYAVTKVLKYPSIVKKVVSYSDNISSTNENIAFDGSTGKPLLTRSYDAYHGIPLYNSEEIHNGSIYNLNIPAHWNYKQMGSKSESEGYTNQLLSSSGQVITYGKGANPINKDNNTWSIKRGRVISASATTYNNLIGVSTWMDENIEKEYKVNKDSFNDIWRVHKSYVYKDETKKSSNRVTESGKIYEGGILNSFVPFDYKSNKQYEKWIKLTEISKYSPHGNVLEEINILNIPSASKYGYNYTQPVMIGTNSTYNEMYFESFEDKPNMIGLEYGTSHSGLFSKKISSGSNILSNIIAGNILASKGGWVNFWVKSPNSALTNPSIKVHGKSYSVDKVARTGEWTLYRSFIKGESFVKNEAADVFLNFDDDSVYIDDVKFSPKESKSTCFVYDKKSLRLITTFDDQHFGIYYQYNDEGKLVRKLIETERGLKVVTETQYNSPKNARDE